jgi:hypothetical protein
VGRFLEVAGIGDQHDRPVDGGHDGRSGLGGRDDPIFGDQGRDGRVGAIL